jgi:hypothetical protein
MGGSDNVEHLMHVFLELQLVGAMKCGLIYKLLYNLKDHQPWYFWSIKHLFSCVKSTMGGSDNVEHFIHVFLELQPVGAMKCGLIYILLYNLKDQPWYFWSSLGALGGCSYIYIYVLIERPWSMQ